MTSQIGWFCLLHRYVSLTSSNRLQLKTAFTVGFVCKKLWANCLDGLSRLFQTLTIAEVDSWASLELLPIFSSNPYWVFSTWECNGAFTFRYSWRSDSKIHYFLQQTLQPCLTNLFFIFFRSTSEGREKWAFSMKWVEWIESTNWTEERSGKGGSWWAWSFFGGLEKNEKKRIIVDLHLGLAFLFTVLIRLNIV